MAKQQCCSLSGVIRIFFDSVVVVDNPNALIRIYPKVLESVCKDAEDGRAYRGPPAGWVLENDGWKGFNHLTILQELY